MAAIIQDNSAEQENLWSCTLSSSTREYTWNPEDPADPEPAEDDEKDPRVKPGHKLLIKSAVLMPSAKTDEVTIVQIESEGYKVKRVVDPIRAMKGCQNIGLLVSPETKFTLLQGDGPIHLVGSHCGSRPNGFARGLTAEEIVDTYGDEVYLVKWKGTDETEFVPAKEVDKKIPQLVIKYFKEFVQKVHKVHENMGELVNMVGNAASHGC